MKWYLVHRSVAGGTASLGTVYSTLDPRLSGTLLSGEFLKKVERKA